MSTNKVVVTHAGKFSYENSDIDLSDWHFSCDTVPTRKECLQAVLSFITEEAMKVAGLDEPAWEMLKSDQSH